MSKLDDLKRRKGQLEARIDLAERREANKARKKRTHDLIQIGGLAEIAKLRDFDRAALLGALLYVRQLAEKDAARVRGWKQNGQAILDAREKERKQRKEQG
jgi:hypothetical protein